MAKLDGKVLREIRTEQGLTQRELAHRAKVDSGTIHRLETGGRGGKTRHVTVQKLSTALQVSEAILAGAAARPKPRDQDQPGEPETVKDQLNLRVDNAARNALALVARRYKVTPAQIVELAPFLFYIAAERSLGVRRRKLSEVWNVAGDLEKVRNSIRNLPRTDYGNEKELFVEEDSIKAADIFGRVVSRAPIHSTLDADDDQGNPFANFLRNEAAEFADAASFVSWWDDTGAPEYRICSAEAVELVGGDAAAAGPILNGAVPLHEMPKEIRSGSPEARALWARARAEEAQKEIAELLGLLDDLPPATAASIVASAHDGGQP
jgi:transcriptional regulator with XRE-family HTH domain